MLTQTPQNFKDGNIWKVTTQIHGRLLAIGLALLVLFFVVGMVKTCTNFTEIKRPEHALRLFLRFAIARGLVLVVYGMEFMCKIFKIVQGITSKIMTTVGVKTTTSTTIPQTIIDAVDDCEFLENMPVWAVTLLSGILITILSFVLILTVYGRFFRLYMYTAISPIPLSASASESTQSIAVTFLKSYMSVCLEGVIIVLACIIFSKFARSPPSIDTEASAISILWTYIGESVFNMLALVGTVKMSNRVVKDMMGL